VITVQLVDSIYATSLFIFTHLCRKNNVLKEFKKFDVIMVIVSVQNCDWLFVEHNSSARALYIDSDSEFHFVPPVFFMVPVCLSVCLNVKILN